MIRSQCASLKSTIELSTIDMPLLPKAEIARKNENHVGLIGRASGGLKMGRYVAEWDIQGATVTTPISCKTAQ